MVLTSRQALHPQLQFTAQLAQTMRLLQLTTPELAALITAELANNPALEITTVSHCPRCGRRLKTLACPICDRQPAAAGEPIVYLAARLAHTRDIGFDSEIEPRATETLADYVGRQIAPLLSSADHALADEVIANLDEHGFLSEAPEVCAKRLNLPLDQILRIIQLIQCADPPGVGARDARESLLIQLDSLDHPSAAGTLARRLIADHWEQLPQTHQNQLKLLAKQLSVTLPELEAALSFIRRNLTPYPALADWHTRRGSTIEGTYVEPDAIIHAPPQGRDEPFSIEVFSPLAGWLRVSDRFKSALNDCPAVERQRLSECVEQAELLVRGLEQRSTTLQHLLATIVREQSAYLLGRESDPKPMTRAQVAQQLGVHESTISRAVANKLVALPSGQLIPLEHFFDQSLAVRHALKAIIAAEQRSLSDDELTQQLYQLGYRVARRTVAKYREIEHILPAHERSHRQL